MKPEYDLIIVGARVAGSTVASLLGEKGYRILLLDRVHFPSDTLSTHFFRDPAFRVLQRLGVLEDVEQIAPKLVNNYNDVDGHVFTEPVEAAEGPSHYLCVRRITLDEILIRRTRREPTVKIREGAYVEDLLWQDGRVAGVQWSEQGERLSANARVVIGADGVNSLVAKKVNPPAERAEPVHRIMYYTYYANLEAQPGPSAEFHYLGNRLVYVFPTDGNLTLIAASLPISEFDGFRREAEGRLLSELESMPTLAPRLLRAERVASVKGTGSIPGYQRAPYGPGWALVGDAAQIMDPWSGQGIDQATTHATILADALHLWLSEQLSWEEALHRYHAERSAFSQKAYERTCKYAPDLRPMTRAALAKRGLLKR